MCLSVTSYMCDVQQASAVEAIMRVELPVCVTTFCCGRADRLSGLALVRDQSTLKGFGTVRRGRTSRFDIDFDFSFLL